MNAMASRLLRRSAVIAPATHDSNSGNVKLRQQVGYHAGQNVMAESKLLQRRQIA